MFVLINIIYLVASILASICAASDESGARVVLGRLGNELIMSRWSPALGRLDYFVPTLNSIKERHKYQLHMHDRPKVLLVHDV